MPYAGDKWRQRRHALGMGMGGLAGDFENLVVRRSPGAIAAGHVGAAADGVGENPTKAANDARHPLIVLLAALAGTGA